MSTKSKKVSHKGTEYEVFYFFGREALQLSYRLGKYIGPSLAAMANADGAPDLSTAVNDFFSHCSESEFTDFVQTMFRNTMIDGKPGEHAWAGHFQGKPGEMMQVIAKLVEVQFQDFFQDWIGGAGKTDLADNLKTRLID
jgi:hypothetical protein